MTRDLVVAQAEQDQQWMELDRWFNENQNTEDVIDVVELLVLPPTNPNLKALRKQPTLKGIEVIRLLALHTLRELMLRQQHAKERIKDDS